jgi:hypothetical protein
VIAPNSAKPTTKPTALVAEKIRFRKSERGRMGSLARDSTSTKAGSRTTLAAMRPSTCHESKAQVVPPRLVKSTIADSAPPSRMAPG